MRFFEALSAPPKNSNETHRYFANPEIPISVGQAAGLSHTGGSAAPVGIAASECIGFGAMEVTKPYEFIGFGTMEVTKPYEFIGFGAMDVTKPYEFIGFGAKLRRLTSATSACERTVSCTTL